jgi:hypothetical protein
MDGLSTMKMLLGVFTGSILAAASAFILTWMLSASVGMPTASAVLLGGPDLSLLVSTAAIIAGAYVAARICPGLQTMVGYATVQLFFGPALIRSFWLGGTPWYTLVALLMVVSLTFIGGMMATGKRFGAALEAS